MDLPYNISSRDNDKEFNWEQLKNTLLALNKAVDLSCTLLIWHNYLHTGEVLKVLTELKFTSLHPIVWVKPDAFEAGDVMISAHETGVFVWPNPAYKSKAIVGKQFGKCVI